METSLPETSRWTTAGSGRQELGTGRVEPAYPAVQIQAEHDAGTGIQQQSLHFPEFQPGMGLRVEDGRGYSCAPVSARGPACTGVPTLAARGRQLCSGVRHPGSPGFARAESRCDTRPGPNAFEESTIARLYASALFCSTRLQLPVERLRRIAGNEATPEWALHVERTYRCALAFSFNGFYAEPLSVRHVLAARFDHPTVGTVWMDWTLLEDKRLGVQSLHVALSLPDLTLQLDDPACPATGAAAGFLQDVYQLAEREQFICAGFAELSRLLRGTATSRRSALGISRYVQASVVCDDETLLSAPSDGARINFYRLLYLHASGVDAATATARLPPGWGSAAFFRLYHQPGGVLAISVPYPPESRASHPTWFEPLPPALAMPPFELGVRRSGGTAPSEYPSYDLLPEYPPLRYLATPALHYAAAYEDTLREVHEAAFAPRWHRWLPRLLRAHPTERHLLASNLEGIRLPIMRDLVDLLLERQLQGRTTSASMEMLRLRGDRRTLIISVVAIIFSIVFADSLKIVDTVENMLSPARAAAAASSAASAGAPRAARPAP